MSLLGMIVLGFALAMDASCVSMVNGMVDSRIHIKKTLYMAFLFGLFQGAMTLIGYLFGNLFIDFISGIDHYIALILLSYIGGKMIYEAFKKKEEEKVVCSVSKKQIYVQALATSIDALAAGISIALITNEVVKVTLVIFLTTMFLSFISVYIGKKCGILLERKAEILGGLILIGIGLEIFLTHVLS